MKRSGFADLPLQGGHVPAWLADRMTRVGAAIAESIIDQDGINMAWRSCFRA